VLGQALAAEGKLDEAHALLEPYVASRLPRLRAAEEDWDRCAEAAWDAAIHALDAGEAPRSWYAAYDRGGEAERERLINAWVQERMERDPVVARARDRHIAAAAVVEVALDLGLLQVQRARQMDDDAARQRQMSAAEQTFLAIRGSAGDTDAYRLALGQAYCWMGRHEEGRAHLDALLEEHQRSAASLLMVGEILREVGAHGEAGAVFEESYAQARSDEERYEAAAARALTAEDPDEELGWLRRADPASPFVRAGVSSALADQSMRQGDEAAAEHHLRQAIGLYAQMPETTSSLNNGALLWMRLHRVTGEPAALEQAAAMVERAVALEPDDSILAHNASEMLLHAAVASLIAGRIEPERVGRGPDLDLLDALYLDQGERGRIAAELAAQPRFTRAMGYAERAILLAPRSAQVRRTLFGARNLLRDEEGVRRLLESTRGVELDLAAEAAALASHLAGEDDQRHRVAAGARTVECRAALDSGVSGPMRALALMGILDSTLTLAALGDAVDPDEVVAMAQAAHEAAPSGDTHAMLLTAHLLRANAELAAAHPEFAALHRAGLRLLPEVHALILGLERCGDLQPAAAAHPDVRRALAIAREQAEAFPGDPAPWMWALWRPFDPAQAEAHAQRVRRDTFGAQRRELRLLLWPGNAWSVYEAAWERLILGDQAGAAAILERCRAQGVPLP
jgi:tetratricopeptide (TPR) repeat protein